MQGKNCMSKTKVWTWGIKMGKDQKTYALPEPMEMEYDDEILENMKFGERPLIECYMSHLSSVMWLFRNEDAAICYQSGYRLGQYMNHDDGEEFWRSQIDVYIDLMRDNALESENAFRAKRGDFDQIEENNEED